MVTVTQMSVPTAARSIALATEPWRYSHSSVRA